MPSKNTNARPCPRKRLKRAESHFGMQLRPPFSGPSSTISTTFLSPLGCPSLFLPSFLVAKGDKRDGPNAESGKEGRRKDAASFHCVSVFVLRIQASLMFRKCSGMRRMNGPTTRVPPLLRAESYNSIRLQNMLNFAHGSPTQLHFPEHLHGKTLHRWRRALYIWP